jgi:thiamine pyrophosphokinase
MHIAIFTGGLLRKGLFVDQALSRADKIFAADSGAQAALEFGVKPELIIGDMDSIKNEILYPKGTTRSAQNDTKETQDDSREVQNANTKIMQFPTEKDETDTELAIEEAIKQGATKITILGGIEGDRIDHVMANVMLMTEYDISIAFVNGNTKCWVAKGPTQITIDGNIHDLLSLIPLATDVVDITSSGLHYPLTHGKLSFGKARGISNVLTQENVTITFTKGTLLLVQTHSHES